MRNFTIIVVPLLVGVLSGPVSALGQCTVVAAPGGNDANPGTVAAPLATPARALQVATPGSVVCLRGGTYVLTADLVADKPLTFQSYPGEAAVLSADYVSASTVGNIVLVAANDVTVQDLELAGGSYYGVHVSSYVFGYPPANTRLQRLKIHHSGYIGIKVDQADNVQVLDSEIYQTGTRIGGGGVDILASIPSATNPAGPGATVRGNYIHDMPSGGIVTKGGTVRALVERNRVERMGAGGIYAGGDTGAEYFRNAATSECIDCVVRNNLVLNTASVGIACWGAQGAQILNNTVSGAASANQAAFFAAPDSLGYTCNNAAVLNNVFVTSDSARMVHVVNPGAGVTFDYNHYYNSLGNYAMWWESATLSGYWYSLGAWAAGTGQDAHSAAGLDPLLDSGLKPLTGSPVVNSGVTLAAVASDYAGVNRPQGPAYDKGAFEVPVTAQVPVLLAVLSGSGQTAMTGTNFGAPLAARLTDSNGQGVAGVLVTFAAPASGAGATLGGSGSAGVVTDAKGVATTGTVTANQTAGSYSVSATATSLAPAYFGLQNTAPATPSLLATSTTVFGGDVSRKAGTFAVKATVLSNGAPVTSGTLQFYVDGALAASVPVTAGAAQWQLPIPRQTKPGTQFQVYGVYLQNPTYTGSRSEVAVVRVQ